MLSNFHILTITHKEVSVEGLPLYALQDTPQNPLMVQLSRIKDQHDLKEIYYLNTCNRLLCFFVSTHGVDMHLKRALFNQVEDLGEVMHLHGEDALKHLFEVASSIHSLVVGEREILRQIRDAYEKQSAAHLTGDQIRLAIQHTIRTAKKVYAQTKIGERPVSVVSLAVQKLMQSFDLQPNSKFLVVGAGRTIQLVLRHLSKKGFKNFSIYNRSKEKASKLMEGLNGTAGDLNQLKEHEGAFDCIIACTGSHSPIISLDLMEKLSGSSMGEKNLARPWCATGC